MHNSTKVAGDFNIPLIIIDETTGQKINRDTGKLNIIKQ